MSKHSETDQWFVKHISENSGPRITIVKQHFLKIGRTFGCDISANTDAYNTTRKNVNRSQLICLNWKHSFRQTSLCDCSRLVVGWVTHYTRRCPLLILSIRPQPCISNAVWKIFKHATWDLSICRWDVITHFYKTISHDGKESPNDWLDSICSLLCKWWAPLMGGDSYC